MSVSSERIIPNLSIIVAMDSRRLIGRDNKLPWRVPEDMKYFRTKTLGHNVIMGRRTWTSLGAPLEQRTNIILTRDKTLRLPGVIVCHSVDDILDHIGTQDSYVIGGAEIFTLFLPFVAKLFITHIDAELVGDAYFPDYDPEAWEIVFYENTNSASGMSLSFNEYHRKQ